MLVPLLLLSMSSDIVLKEKTLSGDVGWVLPVLVIVELLARFSSCLCLRIICGLLRVRLWQLEEKTPHILQLASGKSGYIQKS